MSLKTNKKSIIFSAFLALGFLLLGDLKSTLAVDGLMNGKMITGYSEDYIMWLQTYDQSTAPFFSDKFYIGKNGNVGIGKTNPGYALDVNGAINGTSILVNGVAVGSGGSQWVSGSGGAIYYTGGNVGIGITAPTVKLDNTGSFKTSLFATISSLGSGLGTNSVVMVDTNGGLFSTSTSVFAGGTNFWGGTKNANIWNGDAGVGNVGIGLTNPATVLNIRTSGAAAGMGYILNTMYNNSDVPYWKSQRARGTSAVPTATASGDGLGGFLFQGYVGGGGFMYGAGIFAQQNGAVGTYVPTDLYFLTSTDSAVTERMRITSSGNVGIGTSTPASKLELGNITSGQRALGVMGSGWGDINNPMVYFDGGTASDGNILKLRSLGARSDAEIFEIENSVGTAFVVKGNGNVGVGIASPTYKLQVAGTSYLNGQITTSLSGSGNRCIYVDASGNLLAKTTDCGTATGGDNLGSHIATQNIQLGTNWLSGDGGNEGIFVKADGNVGIGINAPLYRFTVQNDDGVASGLHFISGFQRSAGSDAQILIGYEANGSVVTAPYLYSANSQPLAFYTSGANRLHIATAGNVGINQTNPTAKLQVTGGGVDVGGTVNATGLCIASDCRSSWAAAGSYWTGSGSNISNNNAGNVGIGTTNPRYKLDLGYNTPETIRIGSQALAGTTYSGNLLFGSISLISQAAKIQGFYGTSYNGELAFSTQATGGTDANRMTERMRIDEDGNVGVGTTNPGTLLDVNGYFRATAATLSSIGAGVIMADSSGVLYSTSSLATLGGPYLPLDGADTMTGPLNMGDQDIVDVANLTVNHKLTVYTIDPLYKIKGTNYSTYAASISGGVKEEYVGKINITKKILFTPEYEAVIDFSDVKEGSDLWVWREVVEFNKEAVDIAITPYGSFAQVYYLIEGNKLIFRSDRPVEISYRLIGKRFDWRDWPTRALDQTIQGVEVIR